MQRHFTNLIVDDPARTAAFYTAHFGLREVFTSPWFVHLEGPNGIELGLLGRPTDLLPESPASGAPNVMLTFVVDDVDAWVEAAAAAGVVIEQPPTNRFYGQRVALVRDPAGTWVDVSSPCPPDPTWAARLTPTDHGYREA